MKWCFLVNNASFLARFLGKLSYETIQQGDECIILVNSKIAEYGKKQYFSPEATFFSKVDWCQKEYDPLRSRFGNLTWRYLFSTFDRWPELSFSYKHAYAMVNQLYQFLDVTLRQEKPDVIVTEGPAGLYNEMAQYLCDEARIPYISLIDSVFDRIGIYDKGWTDSRYKRDFLHVGTGDISGYEKKFLETWRSEFVSHTRAPKYVHNVHIRFSPQDFLVHYASRFKEVGNVLFRYIRERKQHALFDYESEAVLKKSFISPFVSAKRQVAIEVQKRYYRTIAQTRQDDQFFVYPLHYQPEASTSVCAPSYTNQVQTIQNIAFRLPFPAKLYVKEHPAAVGTKPNSFYEAMLKIPHVVLIDSKESVRDLIIRSKGVVTLTSTVGLEALLAGKRTYVFGDVFYSFHPLCRIVKGFEDFERCILQEEKEEADRSDATKEINIRFLASCFHNTIKGNIPAASKEDDTNNYKEIVQALRARAREMKL